MESLHQLVEGVEGEEWPRWLGHLPWDVRHYYRKVVLDAREELAKAESLILSDTPLSNS
jgi:hypothetical protein